MVQSLSGVFTQNKKVSSSFPIERSTGLWDLTSLRDSP